MIRRPLSFRRLPFTLRTMLFPKVPTAPVIVVLLGLLPPAARAQRPEAGDRLALQLRREYVEAADFRHFDGGVQLNVTTVLATVESVTFRYAARHFDWQAPNALPFGTGSDPWDLLQSVNVSTSRRMPLTRDWMLSCRLAVGAAFETEIEDSFHLQAGAYAMRRRDDFSVVAGLMAQVHSRLDPVILPVLGLAWRRGRKGWSASIGMPVTELRYRFSDQFAAGLNYRFDPAPAARLADRSDIEPGGYARLAGRGPELGLDWQIREDIRVSIGFAYLRHRELTFFDADGDELEDYRLESAFAAELSVDMKL